MKKITLALTVFCLSFSAKSQFVKAVTFGEVNENINDYVIDIEVGTNLNTYMVGSYATDTIDGIPVPTGEVNFWGNPSQQLFIAKYSNSNHQQEYIKTITGTEKKGQITTGSNESVYFAVQYADTLKLDGQELTTQFDGFGETSMAIGKLDSNGDLLWLKNIESKGSEPKDLILHNGNLYVVGLFNDRIYFENNFNDFNGGAGYDGFIATIDPSTGQTLGLKTIDDGYPEFADAHNDGIILSGTFGDYGQNKPSVIFWDGSTLDVELDENTNSGLNPSNGFFMSLDNSLNINYIQHIKGNTEKQDFAIVNDKIIFSANNTDYIKIDNDSISGKKHLMVRLDLSTGNYLDNKECTKYLGNLDYDLTSQKIYTIVKGGNSSLSYDGVQLAGNPKIAFLVTDVNNNLVDTVFRGGFSTIYSKDISVFDDRLAIGGGITGLTGFSDSIALDNGLYIEGHNIYEDGWFAIYNVSGTSTPTNISQTNLSKGLKVFPNPFQDVLSFSKIIDLIEVLDINGKIIASTENSLNIDLGIYPKGMYVIKTTDKEEIMFFKVLKK